MSRPSRGVRCCLAIQDPRADAWFGDVAAQCESYDLKPAPGTLDFFQTVPLRRRSLLPNGTHFELLASDRQMVFENGTDIAVDASAHAVEETIEAALVFVGWGIRAPSLGHDDYAGSNVKGKAVVILEGAPASFPGALRAHYSWIQQKERMAAEAGAVALLTLKSPERERVSPWDWARKLRPLPALSWKDPMLAGSQPRTKATITLGPQAARTLFAQVGRDLDLIYAGSATRPPHGFELPVSMRLSRRSSHEELSSANVVGV